MTVKTQVFRVSLGQHGKGMYTSDEGDWVTNQMYELSGAHPQPSDDAGLSYSWDNIHFSIRNEYVFGFKSLDQLRQWVYRKEWREGLDDAGFQVHTWETQAGLTMPYTGGRASLQGKMMRPYIIGDTQMVFMPVYFNYVDAVSLLSI